MWETNIQYRHKWVLGAVVEVVHTSRGFKPWRPLVGAPRIKKEIFAIFFLTWIREFLEIAAPTNQAHNL